MSVTVTNSPEGRRILEEIIEAYAAAEANLIGLVRDALAREAIGTAGFYQRQQQALAKVQSDARRALQQLTGGLEESLQQLLISEYQATSTMITGGAVAQGVNAPAIAAVAAEMATTLTSSHTTILRTVIDEYRRIISRGVTDAITSGQPQQQMIQGMLDKFADRGITSFTDRSGRRWSIRSYAEMALRTGVTRAQNEGRRTGYAKTGVELILVSSHVACAPQCLPFQGRVLAMRGGAGKREVVAPDGKTVTVNVVATFDDALRAGYHHPNAVLGGDQPIDTWGKSQAGSKSFYRGPSVTIRTSEGNSLTVSPNHPVLTGRGWVTAQTVRKGDNLFNSVKSRPSAVNIVGAPDLNNMVATVEKEFAALKSRLNVVLIPTAAHDFDDDRQFLEGEVSVVVPDGELLPVPDAHIVKETGEVFFDWSDMRGRNIVGGSSELLGDSPVAGASAPFSPLLDGHPGSFQPSAHSVVGNAETRGDLLSGEACFVQPNNIDRVIERSVDGEVAGQDFGHFRAGDSRDVGDVINAVPGGVQAVNVVDVEFGYFEGHAYDFHTEDGIYSVNGLIVHNCRHTDTPYVPGMKIPKPVETDEKDYKAQQRQREIERNIRRWKLRKTAALDKPAERKANARIRMWQKAQRDHVAEYPWMARNYQREKVITATGK